MQVSVKLQESFSYPILPIIIIILLLTIVTIYIIRKKQEKKYIPVIKENKDIKDIGTIKQKYIKQLEMIKSKLESNKISIRRAYQDMSEIIRYFVYEVTNIKVQYCTLKDIEELDMPILYELIQEYYVPEFSEKSLGDIEASLEKTRKVIEKWN